MVFVQAIGGHSVGGPYKGKDAQILVITTAQSVSGISDWLYSYDADTLSVVDYGRYFGVVAFNGWRGGLAGDFKITEVWQNKSTVYAQANFDDGALTSVAINSSQYEGILIERTSYPLTGLITFKLLDSSGKERASRIQYL